MTTYDNAPPPADWVKQAGRHCGQICTDTTCRVCGERAIPLPKNIELGCE